MSIAICVTSPTRVRTTRNISTSLSYQPPMPPHSPPCARGLGSTKTRGWSKPPMCFSSFKAPQPQCTAWNEPRPPHTTPYLLCTAENRWKNAKTPPALPECASALPGNVGDNWVQLCAHPQGVQWDSLVGFRIIGGGKMVDTPVHALLPIILYVL